VTTLSPPLPDRIEKVFAPYAREVGKLVASWNQLHERLGELFSMIVRKDQPGIALAVWYSVRSDLAQRQMLRASAEAAAAAGLLIEQAKEDDIKWLLDRTGELSHQRNDALHAPVAFFTDQDGTRLMTEYIFGNPRALTLKDKNLPDEFSWYEKKASALSGFALRCAACLHNASLDWPERPKLPNRGE
jgi:hypothetical protein